MFTSKRLLEKGNHYAIQDFYRKEYHYYPNMDSMITSYLQLKDEDKMFTEVIYEGPQKMRLDIDSYSIMSAKEWKLVIKKCYRLLKKFTNGGNVAIFDMSDNNKHSCHMVCTNRAYESHLVCKHIYNLICDEIGDVKQYIDSSIYSKVQHFRMEGSRKPNTTRYKKLSHCDEDEWDIRYGFIGYTDNLEIDHYEIDTQPIKIFSQANTHIKIISDWCKPRQVDGNRVDLTRLKPSYCNVCHRTHDSENPFLVIGNTYGFLYCRRSLSNDHTKIPIINDTLKF